MEEDREITCPICKGMTGIPLVGKGINLTPCPRCGGTGKVTVPPKQRRFHDQAREAKTEWEAGR